MEISKIEVKRFLPRSVILNATGFLLSQSFLPWQALRGSCMSLPFAIAKAEVVRSGRARVSVLESETEQRCHAYKRSTVPPAFRSVDYVEAIEIMFEPSLNSLCAAGIITGAEDPLWEYLLRVNKDFVDICLVKGTTPICEFLLSFYEETSTA